VCAFYTPFYRAESVPLKDDVETGWKLFKLATTISHLQSGLPCENQVLAEDLTEDQITRWGRDTVLMNLFTDADQDRFELREDLGFILNAA
jgi:hypothetical protein